MSTMHLTMPMSGSDIIQLKMAGADSLLGDLSSKREPEPSETEIREAEASMSSMFG